MKRNKSTKKLHILVEQSKELFRYNNGKWKRCIWVACKLTPKPSEEVQREIDEKLEEMNVLTTYQGKDSTPEERHDYRLRCKDIMQEIKVLDYNYYWSIQIQDE